MIYRLIMFVFKSLLMGLVTAVVFWYLKYTWSRRRLYSMAAKIPGPDGLPFFGMALSVLGKNHEETFKNVTEITKGYESPSRVWAGPICVIIVDQPEDLQIVLNSQNCIDKAAPYKLVPIETGLLVSGGELWRAHRKLINPSFYMKVLHSFQPVFNEKAKMMVQVMKKYLNTGHFDVYHHMSSCTLEALLATSIGLNKDIQNEENNKYLRDVEIGAEIISERLFKVWLHGKLLFRLTELYKREKKYVINGMLAIADDVLREKSLQNNEEISKNEESNEDKELNYKKPLIFIDQLFNLRHIFSQKEIKDEINTVIVAGHETSALTMSAALLMLAMHQDVQEKVLQEIEVVFNSVDEEVDNLKLNELPYLEMVIKECMRLFPVLPMTGRHCSKDIELNTCTIPAGCTIMINIYNAQRCTKSWGEDAHLFKPERFSQEHFSKIHPYAYIPFSAGPRICIGLKYAMNIMKVVLVHFLRNYKITTALKYHEINLKVAVSLKIVQKYMIQIETRDFK